MNPAAARMLGWSVEELTGQPLDDEAMPVIAATLRERAARSGEATLRRRDGSSFPGEFTTTPIANGAGSVRDPSAT